MNHHHHHETEHSLSFEEKLDKILRHWIRHNDDHVSTYKDWMKQANKAGLKGVAQKLEEATKLVTNINTVLEEAATELRQSIHP